jgi:hypothetical protein
VPHAAVLPRASLVVTHAGHGTVMAACTALFVVAPIVGWWLPKAVSSHAEDIDFLFYLILADKII